MLIATAVPAGTPYSPSRQGTVTRRPIIGITGRERIVSTIVASICSSASSPARTASSSASWASGLRTRRSQAQASELAVVSWPARTRDEQLVAQFFVVQRLALLGPRLQQQREDVAALARGRRRGGAP